MAKEAGELLRARVEEARRTAGAGLRGKELEELERLCKDHKLGENINGWKNPFPADDPRALLLEYQFAWREDPSRWKLGLMSRQSGKDFSSNSEIAEDCLRHPMTEWMIAAPSERQALDSLEQCKTWAQAFDLKIADYNEERSGGSGTVLKAAEVIFSNKSRARAVPGKPDTVRGRSAKLLLTEFDFFEQPALTWRAILPSITNPLRGGEKCVRLITTPNGIGSAMNKLWVKEPSAKMAWSKHLVTIYDAVLMGLPVDIEQLREAFGDADGWAQEFCCRFVDTASVLLGYDLIAGCEGIEATEAVPAEYWGRMANGLAQMANRPFPVDLGIDFGRKRDLTVCWAAEKISDLQVTREVLCLEKMSTPEQVEILRPRIEGARRVCLDYTGPGVGLGDYLVKEFKEWNPEKQLFGKIELVTFTNNVKVELFSKLRMAFEKRNWRIPVNVTIREDLHSLYRVVTPNGNVTFRAPHSEDGHADRATALALCTRAGAAISPCGKFVLLTGKRAEAFRERRDRSVMA